MPADPPLPVPAPLRCGIVGAGRRRHGLGPFLASFLEAAGGAVVAVSGRSRESAAAAAAALEPRLGHRVDSCASAEALLASGLDAVLITAPDDAHLPVLRAALAAGVPTLCEKPLARAEEWRDLQVVIADYRERGLLLMEHCQWPFALPAHRALFGGAPFGADPLADPLADSSAEPPARVAMRLSPMAPGPSMLRSSLSHLLSVVQALVPVGAGTVLRDLRFAGSAGAVDGLVTTFLLQEPAIACRLELGVCPTQPRPAWLEIDGRRMERVIGMPDYDISFVAGENRVSVDDPSRTLVYRFAQHVREACIERNRIEADGIEQRARLYSQVVGGLDDYLAAS